MAQSRMREDVESAYLDITEYTGQSLTGPRDLISRKVVCSNPQVTMTEAAAAGAAGQNVLVNAAFDNLQQLNFRILSTSPGAMINSKVVLVLPMFFHHMVSHTGAQVADVDWLTANAAAGNNNGTVGMTATGMGSQYAPRRNGILKACRTISTTVNSTVSFQVNPSDGLDVMEQIFTQQGSSGQTGIYNECDSAGWGNNDGKIGIAPHNNLVTAGSKPGWARYRSLFNPAADANNTFEANKGFIDRRADFISGGGALADDETRGGINDFARNSIVNYCKYDYKTTLSIPPFKTFQKDIYSRSPTWIPYIDSCDVMLNFWDQPRVKAALLQCASISETAAPNMVVQYSYGLYDQPYLEVEWCVPPVQLRPSYTIPCWRNQHYSQRFTFPVGDGRKRCTFQGIRLDSMPSLISVHVTDSDATKVLGGAAAWQAAAYHWTEFNGTLADFSITINEKLNVLSDKSPHDLYKLYRMYAPDSKMSYTVWRELRQLILIRSDCLALEKGQGVFNPTNITLDMQVGKAIQHLGSACTQEVHLNFWYFSDALTLSQQAAAVTSQLLSPNEVAQLRITPESKEIQTLMEMGLQS